LGDGAQALYLAGAGVQYGRRLNCEIKPERAGAYDGGMRTIETMVMFRHPFVLTRL